jgi:hypothetical protein
MEKGDKVRTIYGKIETVLTVEPVRIITYESARRLCWYHPTKVFRLDGSAIHYPVAE